jgi:histone acetyltransferase (RNA polymerase elongator complex component)
MTNYYIIPVFVPHKGCPHDCVFCNQRKITGRGHNSDHNCSSNNCDNTGISDYNSENEVTAEMVEKLIDDYLESIHLHNKNTETYIELSFFGGSVTAIPMSYQNELLSVAKIAKDHGRINAIRLSTRPDYITIEILDNLIAHKVDVIELGVQSMDEEVLLASERGHGAQCVIDASTLIKDYGFKLGLQMMLGLPKDNLQKDLYTANEIIKLRPDFVRIYPTLVIKETNLEQDFYKGLYKPLSLDDALAYSKELYELFTYNSIPIIRLGLQPTEQISLNGDVVAGPFHPAFRELVESMVLNNMLQFAVKEYFFKEKEILVEVSPKDISKLYADKKRFFNESLKNLFDKTIAIRQNSSLNRLDMCFISVEKARNMSLYDYLKWKY